MDKQLTSYIKFKTQQIDFKDISFFSSNAIALDMEKNRAQISRELNGLVREGILIKTNTRPVYFFHRQALEEQFHTHLTKNVFNNLEELLQELKPNTVHHIFSRLIGYNGSLNPCINQCIAAINYPGNGLPILLQGASGTGKSYIAQLIYQYAYCTEKIKGKFMTINCAEYSNNPELFLTNVFGYKKGAYTGADKDQNGILYHANDGILFLDEVHGLLPECQEKIFQFMDSGMYHRVGDNENWYHSHVQIIMATTENPNDVLLKTLLRRIPLIVQIPNLNERPLQERKELIRYLFSEEEQCIQRKIEISRMVYHILQSSFFQGNIGKIKNIIKTTVANALLKSTMAEVVHIHIRDFPPDLLKNISIKGINLLDDKKMLKIETLLVSHHIEQHFYHFNKDIINYLNKNNKSFLNESEEQFIYDKVKIYIDYLFYDSKKSTIYDNSMGLEFIEQALSMIEKKYFIKRFSNNEMEIVYRFISNFSGLENIDSIGLTISEVHSAIQIVKGIQNFQLDKNIIKDFIDLIKDTFLIPNIEIFELDLMILFMYLFKDYDNLPATGLIIAHGYSIASEMAKVTNQLLQRHIFDAIDMPIHSDFDDIVEELKRYLDSLPQRINDVIVLVDMGLLEIVHENLKNYSFNIGIINNVTTRMSLEVGNKLIQNEDIKHILEQTCAQNVSHFTLVRKQNKPDLILTVCETGIGMANMIVSLVKKSFPKDVNILVVPYDYHSLLYEGKKLPIFENYHVCFILGTQNPQIDGIPFLSIYDIMDGRNKRYIEQLIRGHLNIIQIEEFCREILKNFSIENLKNYLNIISPKKIIRYIEKITDNIQKMLEIEFNPNLLCCLYIHISCMIERVLLHEEIDSFEGIDQFIQEHKDFYIKTKKTFKEIEQMYSLSIPDQEIVYLYEYIYSQKDDSVTEKENSVINNDYFLD